MRPHRLTKARKEIAMIARDNVFNFVEWLKDWPTSIRVYALSGFMIEGLSGLVQPNS